MRNRIQKYAQNHQRFCLTYVPAAPHYPYDKIPEAFRKYKMAEVGDFRPVYLNELLYMDWVLASILDQLKESDLLDQTLVIITNDHGEMLGGKDGHIGHGWAVTPELVNTPLIVMDPAAKGLQVNPTIGSQVDLLPTVLDRLGIAIPADQLYEGQSLYAGGNRQSRQIYLNSYKQYAVVSANQIVVGDRENDTPQGEEPQASAFTFTNQGTKTVFSAAEHSVGNAPAPSIEQFDKFQESLLRNYAAYQASLLRK
jgi:arylsulfatase A-like enzyme